MEPIFQEQFYTTYPGDATLRTAAYRLKGRFDSIHVLPAGRYPNGESATALVLGNPHGAAIFVGRVEPTDWQSSLLLLWFAQELAQALEEKCSLGGSDPARLLEKRGILLLPALWGDAGPLTELADFWQQLAPVRQYSLYDRLEGVAARVPAAVPAPPSTGLIARLLASCGPRVQSLLPGERPSESLEVQFIQQRLQPAMALGLGLAEGEIPPLAQLWEEHQERLLLAALL